MMGNKKTSLATIMQTLEDIVRVAEESNRKIESIVQKRESDLLNRLCLSSSCDASEE